jgi:hypothetical protein
MTRQRLELLWHSVERQIRWAAAHGGDQELLDLLRHESDRLSTTIDQCAPTPNIFCESDGDSRLILGADRRSLLRGWQAQ